MLPSMVLLLNGTIDLSSLVLCFLWGSSWCVAVLIIFKCLLRGNSGKLNCHIGRILQQTKICMKKINEAQNVINWFKYQPSFAWKSVSGLCSIYCIPHRSSVFGNWRRMGAKFVCPFPELPQGQFCLHLALTVCRRVVSYRNDKLSWDAGMSPKEFPFKEAHKPLAVTSVCDSAVYLILIKHLTGFFLVLFCRKKSFLFSALYAAFIFGGRHLMNKRAKFELRKPLVLWSLSLAVFR